MPVSVDKVNPRINQVFTPDVFKSYSERLGLNQIITGWQVSAGTGLSVDVGIGKGIVNGYYGETTATKNLSSLTANATLEVYAEAVETVNGNVMDIRFNFGTSLPSNALHLATITTDASGVTSVVDKRQMGVTVGNVLLPSLSSAPINPPSGFSTLFTKSIDANNDELKVLLLKSGTISEYPIALKNFDVSTVNSIEFTAAGNYQWTVPSNIALGFIDVILIGGGGGGGSGIWDQYAADWNSGAGAASGEVCKARLVVSAGDIIDITVGAGGSGGDVPATNDSNGNTGSNGSDSSISINSVVVLKASGGESGRGGTKSSADTSYQARGGFPRVYKDTTTLINTLPSYTYAWRLTFADGVDVIHIVSPYVQRVLYINDDGVVRVAYGGGDGYTSDPGVNDLAASLANVGRFSRAGYGYGGQVGDSRDGGGGGGTKYGKGGDGTYFANNSGGNKNGQGYGAGGGGSEGSINASNPPESGGNGYNGYCKIIYYTW